METHDTRQQLRLKQANKDIRDALAVLKRGQLEVEKANEAVRAAQRDQTMASQDVSEGEAIVQRFHTQLRHREAHCERAQNHWKLVEEALAWDRWVLGRVKQRLSAAEKEKEEYERDLQLAEDIYQAALRRMKSVMDQNA